MEAILEGSPVQEQSLLDGLKDIAGAEHVAAGPDAAKRFLRPGQEAPGLIVVSPKNTEDVQAIVNLARESNISILTCNDRFLLPEDLDRKAILLDFSRLIRIEQIDSLNLVARVERGVTWDQLNAELKKLGIKAPAPVAANSTSVTECAGARVVYKAASRFPHYILMNLKLVMADGSIHKTGSHVMSEEGAEGLILDGGPSISGWYSCSEDIFGIATRSSICLWPVCESRTCQVYAFDDYDSLLAALKVVPRHELGVEYLGINRTYMKRLLGENAGELPPWTLVIGFEGRAQHVAHNQDRVKKIISKYPCKPLDNLVNVMTEQLDQPWMEASLNHTAFFSLFSRMKDLDATCNNAAGTANVSDEDVGKVLVSYDLGRAVYAVYDWFSDIDHTGAIEGLNLLLADQGAFFDRPHGDLARKIFTSIPNQLPLLKRIKGILDPENLLNPERTVKDEDKEWQPLKVNEGEMGLTVENLQTVKGKLVEAIGEDWVSDNPADLVPYGRDFTIFSGERPNLVVLPSSTEEVQAIIRIAYAHGIPVVPLSTGFNHGGLTVSRKGGILVDLKRIDQTCTIDEESMTVTVGPGVRMRSIWWDAIHYRATDESHLKPILPLTLGSVSLLSNYVARGGAGTAFKYGGNPDLTTDMTWVLPNGEVFKVGPSAIPNVGKLPLQYCSGPELNGMFFNADGMFGICTELTAKLYPERDDIDESEDLVSGANMDPDGHVALSKTIDAIYEFSRENITEFMYKAHPGVFALAVASLADTTVEEVIHLSPKHPLGTMISGYDREEVEIKKQIITEIFEKHGLMVIDPAMFGQEVADMQDTGPAKMSLGIKTNIVGSYKGAFQWTACCIKMDKIPELAKEYDKLVHKYWKTSDPKVSLEHAMTGTDIQGPLQYGRAGSCEFDWWWDQGNPESVKRAISLMHKTNKLMLKHSGVLFRNMFGSGEYHMPVLGSYYTILKKVKKSFDPANLMHPDVLPVTDDYV